MTIEVGQKLPQATFHVLTSDGVQARTTDEVFAGKKVLLFAVPGAFTPTCHKNHLPGYLENAETLRGKGFDAIAVTSTNDAFVLDAWAKATGAEGIIEFLADGNGDFAKAIGLSSDGSSRGMGIRSQRYSMTVDDGVVTRLAVEQAPGKADISGAAALLKEL
jgi:glutaredoxin/glutathione-dependent peroxiredoxin